MRNSNRHMLTKKKKASYHPQASPQMASKNDYHELQQNLLPQQNNPPLGMDFPY